MATKTIVELALVILVIAFLIWVPTKGWPIVKTILNMNPEQETISSIPVEISNKFPEITNSYEKCFNSSKKECLCNIDLMTFPDRYVLEYSNIRISLTRVKEEYSKAFDILSNADSTIGSVGSKIFSGKNINCYITYNKNLVINNIADYSYLFLASYPKTILFKEPSKTEAHYFVNKQPTFYKEGNNICFVLEDKLSKDGRDYINKLSQC
ncbi:MAG: hypothetical protein PHF86_09170 [Candidatus Nanoarchaeia archaeon]|nr:hypothetical protein [Candidatus Nanoarchaeia archaeon]